MLKYINDIQLTVSDQTKPTILPRELCEWIFDGISTMPTIEVSPEGVAENATTTDCISRQAAIEAVANVIWHFPNECYQDLNDYGMAMALAMDALAGMPPVTPKVSEDAISREVAIDIIKNYDFEFPEYTERFVNELRDAMKKDLVEDITNAPSAAPTERTGWIPVSERLPDAEYGEGDSVLCCTESGLMYILYWNGGNWCIPTGEPHHWVNHKTGWHDKVIAWQPLPEPYKGGEE